MDLIRSFREGDIMSIYPELEPIKQGSLPVSEYERMAWLGSSYTVEDKDDVLFVGSAIALWPGCGNAWFLISQRAKGRGLLVTRGCIEITDAWGRQGFRRVHALINPAFPEDVRWAKTVGFEHESTMFKALPDGKDVYTYVKWLNNGG